MFTSPNGRYLWGLSPYSATATVIDMDTERVVKVIPNLGQVFNLAFDPSGRYAYIPNPDTGTVWQLDAKTFSVVRQLQLGGPLDNLTGIAALATAHGDSLYVGAGGHNFVYVLDVGTGAKSQITVADQPFAIALAGTQVVVAHYTATDVEQIDTATNTVTRRYHAQSSVTVSAAISAHTVALSGFGFTQWLDTTTHRWSHTLPPSFPGYLSGVTSADNGRYTLTTSVDDRTLTNYPFRCTVQVIDNTGYRLRRIVSVGTEAWSVASGSGKVAVIEDAIGNNGPTSVWIIPLARMLEPSSLTLHPVKGEAGLTIHGDALGFNPRDSVVATLHSSKPIQVAKATVGLDTTVKIAFKIPHGTAPGRHTLVLTDQAAGNLSATATLIVPAPPQPRPTATATAMPTPSRSAAPLANTGTHTAALSATGGLLVLAGAMLLVIVRRRTPGRHG